MVQLLLDSGADIEAKDRTFGDTPLHWAVQYGPAPVVEALLARGADIEAANKRNSTPLERALFNDTTDMVQLLLKGGANPNMPSHICWWRRASAIWNW